MPRKPRQEVADGVFHVYAHGIDDTPLFRTVDDRRTYLQLLEQTVLRQRWRLLGYCLMTTHMHLLVQTPDPNLGEGMMLFHGSYAQEVNRRYGRRGHVFERRYNAIRVETDAYLATLVRYIALNPVSAGMVTEPAEWPWSSHRGMLDDRHAHGWLDRRRLLELLTPWSPDPLAHYRTITTPGQAP